MDNLKKSDYIKEIQIKRIREYMDLCRLTGKETAERLNYTPQHISLILNGKRNLTIDMAVKFANLFSEYLGIVAQRVEIPYYALSRSEQEDYINNIDDNGDVAVFYDEQEKVDYRYLMGETDYKTFHENFDPPIEKTTNYLFQEGIKAILHHYGYDLKIGACPDITKYKSISQCDFILPIIIKTFNDKELSSQIIKRECGESIEMLPKEIYQLYQDFIKSILAIVERRFEKQAWESVLNISHEDSKK